jgi:hypothetical protein
VLFLQDSSNWSLPFDFVIGAYTVDSEYGCDQIEQFFSHFGLSGRWAYYSKFEQKLYGWRQADLDRFCASADLLTNISGLLPLRENYMHCRLKAIIDTVRYLPRSKPPTMPRSEITTRPMISASPKTVTFLPEKQGGGEATA